MLVRSFTANKISGTRHQSLLHAISNIFVFVSVLPPIERICKNVLPYIGHSFHSRSGIRDVVVREGEIPSDPVAGRVRGMVVGQGSYKQKTLSVTRNMVV